MVRLRSEDLSARVVDDEMIILDLQGSKYLSVTGVGVRLMELLAEERSFEQLVAAISSEYQVDPSVARHDAEIFVQRLRASNLLVS